MARTRHVATPEPATQARGTLESQRADVAQLISQLQPGAFNGMNNAGRWELIRRCCMVGMSVASLLLAEMAETPDSPGRHDNAPGQR